MTDTFEALSHRTDAEAFEPGEPIYRESEPGSVVFLLLEGEVVLERAGQAEERVAAGELFGEAALFGESRRLDTARAVTAVRVVPIGPALYANLAERDSRFAWSVRTSRSRRLKRIGSVALLALLASVEVLGAQVWEVGDQLLLPQFHSAGMRHGDVLAAGDLDADGSSDLVIGAPDYDFEGMSGVGRAQVQFGGANGLGQNSIFGTFGAQVEQEMGSALAVGDFDGDGDREVVVGSPGLTLDSAPSAIHAGGLRVWQVSTGGFALLGDWSQDEPGVLGLAEAGDRFGSALAVGDFNGDGFDDLAVGSPHEDVGAVVDAGAVNVLYGGPAGLTATGNQIWYRSGGGIPGTAATYDALGWALAAGDFDGNGIDDLAIGIPGDRVGDEAIQDGSVLVLPGTFGGGLVAGGLQQIDRDLLGTLPPGQLNSQFGATLAAGDFGRTAACVQSGTCADDLVVGAPNATADGQASAGLVFALFGDWEWGGLDIASAVSISQGVVDVSSGTPPEQGERFGGAIAVGSLSGGLRADLAIGTRYEGLGGDLHTGCAHVARSLAPFYDPTDNPDAQFLWAMPGYESAPIQPGMEFGSALAIGDFNGDGWGDLAVGIAGFFVAGEGSVGAVQILYGAQFADGFESAGKSNWSNF